MKIYTTNMNTPIGRLYVKAGEEHIYHINWGQPAQDSSLKKRGNKILEQLRMQIDEYFKGKRKIFDLPFKLKGTAFQKKIWKEISDIPFGDTLSYKQLAEEVDSPNAFRATGTACGANPLSLIIPCHRVISSRNELAGYGGGLGKKKWLLDFESSQGMSPEAK